MSQKKRSDKNSTSAALAGFAGAMEPVPLQEGVTLRNDNEHVIWGQFSRARARDDWRDMDLILLTKIVKMESDIRKHQDALDQAGVLLENKRGTMVANPLLTGIDALERRQMAVIRSMSLNQQASDPRTINATAKNETSARQMIKSVGVEGVVAKPMN